MAHLQFYFAARSYPTPPTLCWLSSPCSLDLFSLGLTSGAVVVVRPDGIVGYAATLEEGGRIAK